MMVPMLACAVLLGAPLPVCNSFWKLLVEKKYLGQV